MKIIINPIVFLFLLLVCSNLVLAQHKWEDGIITSKSESYSVKISKSQSILFQRFNDDPRLKLEFGYSIETGRVEVSIESAKEFVSILSEAFPHEKMELMAKNERQFGIGISIDEAGIPFHVDFNLRPKSLITPEELIVIEKEIIKRVRYRIRREKPYGQPCIYTSGIFIKFQDILNGEILGLKINEQKGKEKPEWER